MREILFRGKRIDNGEWVEGRSIFKLINKSGERFFIPRFNEKVTATHDDNMNIIALEGCILYKVDPETVGQYTGLIDKNGLKIFEGDIVKITDKYGKSVVYVVEFYMGAFTLRRMDVEYRLQFIDFPLRYYDFEIIGNIHDNKDLLKVYSREHGFTDEDLTTEVLRIDDTDRFIEEWRRREKNEQ